MTASPLKPSRFPLLLATLLLSACSIPVPHRTTTTQPAPSSFINARALIIVRHADISIPDKKTLGDQTPLTPRGQARAQELAYALQDAGINRIVVSETLRTRETAALLAQQLHLTPEIPFSHGNPTNSKLSYAQSKLLEAHTIIDYLSHSSKPDDILLLTDHHSVIPSILTLLGYPDEPPFIEESEFDRVYIVIPNPTLHTYHIMRLRYGGTWGTQHPAP